MALLPLDAGVLKLTLACVLPAVAVPMIGAPGTVPVTLSVKALLPLPPEGSVAVTAKVDGPLPLGVPLSTPPPATDNRCP